MKTKMILLTLMLLALMLSAFSCDKDRNKEWTILPPETMEGKNAIGCMVNGKLWATNHWGGWGGFIPAMIAQYNIYKDSIYIYIDADKKDHSGISLLVKNPKVNIFQQAICLWSDPVKKGYFPNSYRTSKGNVFFTKIDTVKRIVSGRFSFSANNDSDSTRVKVEDGRFDMYLKIVDYRKSQP